MRKTIEEEFNKECPGYSGLGINGGAPMMVQRDDALRFIKSRDEALTSHNAELARKIEKFIDENDDGMWAGRETAEHILSLINSKRMK